MTYQSWFAKVLVTMTVAILMSSGVLAGSAAACGFPGQFGGCLAHGNFDPSAGTKVTAPARHTTSSYRYPRSGRKELKKVVNSHN
jgi:hypothetical protein